MDRASIMSSELHHILDDNSDSHQIAIGHLASSVLFVVIILYFWIGLSPFSSLAERASLPVNSSNPLNQLVMMSISLSVIAMLTFNPAVHLAVKLLGFLLVIFLWLAITSLAAPDPLFALRRLIYALLTCVCACGVLLLPRNSEHFARLMGICLLFMLALCYLGVLILPSRAIHQASDAVEIGLAGDWRGFFLHKNTAAAAMVYCVFLGLFIRTRSSAGLGLLIVTLSAVFLWKTGGKTAAAMLPAILFATWFFERAGHFRLFVVGLTLALMNYILISAAVSRSMQAFLKSNGIDATFTDRAAIWRIAISAISNSPMTGYGFQSFWGSDAVYRGEAAMKNWAVMAASAHNGYLELLLHGGWPLLVLMLLWMVILPCRHIGIAIKRKTEPSLTRLFIHCWLFSVFLGCLESAFLTGEQMWFMMLVSLFGLKLQAYADPILPPSTEPTKA
ncbi:O-antigen ligase [Neorhizobium sp. NCHU2750]|uniref:O-antigen ligase family protein n=1 Tax=Neorhizobium sp. NCHU2750 TaxID=1825976 RepID=UPI000E759FB7|nr:O-antigen polymerase [Neorhizobium sp. NCHU2750]